MISSSPACSFITDKSIELLRTLAGVPVLSLWSSIPKSSSKLEERWLAGPKPDGPDEKLTSPIKILALR